MACSNWSIKILLLSTIIRDSVCGLFDYTDFNDPYQLLLNTKNRVVNEPNTPCAGIMDYNEIEGVCKNRAECKLTGGVTTGILPIGTCGLLSTCCAYVGGCRSKFSSKISYFTSTLASAPQSCTYQVKLHNRNICQLRLDFLEMSLKRPAVEEPNAGSCRDEKFYVEEYPNIPEICGKNTGQHLYVPVNGNDSTPVTIHVDLIGGSVKSSWTIKITQLQCPGVSVFPYRAQMTSMANDFHSLAPRGCLQYFTNQKGTFKSFGYDTINPSASMYNTNQKYAICFKRYNHICSIRFNTDYFRVGTDTASATDLTDFLYIPALQTTDVSNNGKVGGRKTKNNFYISNTPGPFYVYFVADLKADATSDLGFNIKYELVPCPL